MIDEDLAARSQKRPLDDPAPPRHRARACAILAAKLRGGKIDRQADLLAALVERVSLHENRISISLDRTGLSSVLDLTPDSISGEAITIDVPALRIRRGHQLRLIISGPQSAKTRPARRDAKLVALLSEAVAARELVEQNPERSIAALAGTGGRCRTRSGKLVRLSCLAPNIIQAIVEGRQPAELTTQSLSRTSLPLDWKKQRELLGFA